MTKLRVGIIGCGNIGRRHARAYHYHAPRTHLVAVCDVRPDAAAKLAEEFSCDVEESIDSLLKRSDIDAVSICTIETAHLQPALKAAAAGRHILLEKPIAMDLDDARRIKDAAEQAGIKLMIGHLYRFDHRCLEARQVVASGRLGKLISIEARFDGTPAQQDRIKEVELSIVHFRGCHGIDLMRWLSGSEPVRVYCESAEGTLRAMGYHSEDAAFCLIRFADGTIGSMVVTAHVPPRHPTAGRVDLTIAGTKGMLQMDLAQPWLTVADANGFSTSQGNQKDLIFREEIAAFAEVVLDNKPNPASADDAIAALRVAMAAVESARLHRPVDLAQIT